MSLTDTVLSSKVILVGTGTLNPNAIYSYTFKTIEDSHLEVYVEGVLQTIVTDYTVTGTSTGGGTPGGDDNGGTIIFESGSEPAVNDEVIIRRVVTLDQQTDIPSAPAKFPEEAVETALDKLTMIDQQLQEASDRSLQIPVTLSGTVSATLPTPTASLVLGWNSAATGLENVTGIPADVAYSTGTWTPTLVFSGGSTGITYSTQTGEYTRLGDMVFVQIYIVLTSKGSDTGFIRVSLPVTVGSTDPSGIFSVLYGNWASTGMDINGRAEVDTLYMRFYDSVSGNSTLMVDTDLDNTASMRITGWYQAA